MEQQQYGFSDSTTGAGSDRLQNSAKSLLSALQLISISQISTQKYGGRPENFEIKFFLNSKELIIFSHFFFRFCN